MDHLNAMRAFARVIDEGSFAAAARKFNLSPPVMTRLVAELEEHLGARLINRTTRRISLTPAGETYLERVRQILADVEDADAQLSAATNQPRGHLRVVTPPAFAVHQLAKHLPEFRQRYPLVNIVLAAPGPVSTVDETYDVTIIHSTQPLSGDFVARPIAMSEVIVCASPQYLDRRGRPQRPSDLSEHDSMIPPVIRELSFHRRDGVGDETDGQTIGLSALHPALSTTHVDTMYAAALAGLGIAGIPSFVAADALQSRALEHVLPDWRLFTSTVYVAMPTRKHLPARTRAFLDFLLEKIDGEGGKVDPWLRAAGT
jgi:DNA-binding transcriptional LysR family regulator